MSTTAARSFVLLFAVALAVITPATLARAETTTTAALYAVTPRPPVPTRPARPAAPCLPGTPIGGTVGSVGGPPLELTAGCYVVTSDISVPANVTFTIDPAVTLQFNGNLGLFINGGGTLSADASADPNSPSITFTTNNPVPAPGQWMGVYFQSNSAGIISNALVQFAGANRGAGQFGIRVDANSAPTLDTLIVDSGSGLGIDVEGGCPAVTNDTITNNASYGLFLNTNLACDPSLANLTYSGNGNNNWIYLNGSGLSGARTLPNVGADYFLPNDISVPNQASLTIMDPGVVLHFTTGTGLFVNGGGTLIID